MGVSKDQERVSPRRREGAKESTPNSKIDRKGPPSTPFKQRTRSNSGESVRGNTFGSAVRSLTPLFNGFSAAQQRASQLGGRYGTLSRRSVNIKKKQSDGRKRRVSAENSSGKKRLEVQGGVRKPARRVDDVSQLSMHTAPLEAEKRVLKFSAIIETDLQGTKADEK